MSIVELSAADVARSRRTPSGRTWSRTTAWRFLIALEKQYGATVVYRRGRRLYTTAEALARVSPTSTDERLKARLADAEAKLADQDRRINRLAAEFRALVDEWKRGRR